MSRAFRHAAAVVLLLAPAIASAQMPIAPAPPPSAPPIVVAPPVAAPPVVVGPPVVAPPAAASPVAVAPPLGAPPPLNPFDGECVTTTTTTTRCTGAAAPYAAQPAAPVVVAPQPPPAWIPVQLPSGWTLHQDPDGSLWRERRHRGTPGLWAPGLVLWMVTYVGSEGVGLASGQPWTMMPLIGDFISAAASDGSGAQVGWALGGLAQVGGFVMFVAGAVSGEKLERLPITVAPTVFYGGGSGAAITGRF